MQVDRVMKKCSAHDQWSITVVQMSVTQELLLWLTVWQW